MVDEVYTVVNICIECLRIGTKFSRQGKLELCRHTGPLEICGHKYLGPLPAAEAAS